MTESVCTVTEEVFEGERSKKREEKGKKSEYSRRDQTNGKAAVEWGNSKRHTFENANESGAIFAASLSNMSPEEYARKLAEFNAQNGSYMKNAYPSVDPRAYYGWMPTTGFNPMRVPAFIYPHSLVGFAPTFAWMQSNDSNAIKTFGKVANVPKVERWKGSRKEQQHSICNSDLTSLANHDGSTVYAKSDSSSENVSESVKATNSDEDEGMVLDERETLKRRRQKDAEKNQTPQDFKITERRSSVIQENKSIHVQQSALLNRSSHLFDDKSSMNTEIDQNKPAKRGRASTRQIEKTEQYWDRRKKNNMSAKKSRDARRQREALINQRAAMLETENLRLRAELATVRDENSRLKQELNSLKMTQSSA
ncbi:uncharacterized protein LOC124452548 [Xenia sp. Carnegie-2017]|uniref:uncharacterized protein LOC124452548 n=1 Tax=Xenia sp. Carnegie-2017 TaxID=2897299 RepID=UPI001F04298D|nr:uncharacterized protein LOC124452548 [Xenia sp. Carnegie-2017]